MKFRQLITTLVGAALLVGLAATSHAQDALSKMELAFEGEYTRSEIKRQMDKALRLYGLPPSEEYYSRAGSVLVSLANEYSPSEMEILDCVINSYTPDANVEFPDMAGLCATILN